MPAEPAKALLDRMFVQSWPRARLPARSGACLPQYVDPPVPFRIPMTFSPPYGLMTLAFSLPLSPADCQCRGKSPPPSYPSHEGGGKPGPKPKPHPDPKRTPVAESYQPGTEGQKGKTSRRKPHKRDLAALADLVEEGEELALL